MLSTLFRILALAALIATPFSASCATIAAGSVVVHCPDKMDHDAEPVLAKLDCTIVACAATLPEFGQKPGLVLHANQPVPNLPWRGAGIVAEVATPPPKIVAS